MAAHAGAAIAKAIPSSGKKIPVIGVGTNNYNVTGTDELAARRAVLEQLPMQGGALVDTAPLYGRAEGRYRRYRGRPAQPRAAVPGHQGHDPRMRRPARPPWKNRCARFEDAAHRLDAGAQSDRRRSPDSGAAGLEKGWPYRLLRHHDLGAERAREDDGLHAATAHGLHPGRLLTGKSHRGPEVLPLAAQKGIAVIANSPFGGRRAAASVFAQVAGKSLPDWAAAIQCTTWSQCS